MINKPFENIKINTEQVIDIAPRKEDDLTITYSDGSPLLLSTDFETNFALQIGEVVTVGEERIALSVNCDEENMIPMLMIQEGYHWEPVWTRRFF